MFGGLRLGAALGHRPALRNEQSGVWLRQIEYITHMAADEIDAVNSLGVLLRQPDFHMDGRNCKRRTPQPGLTIVDVQLGMAAAGVDAPHHEPGSHEFQGC